MYGALGTIRFVGRYSGPNRGVRFVDTGARIFVARIVDRVFLGVDRWKRRVVGGARDNMHGWLLLRSGSARRARGLSIFEGHLAGVFRLSAGRYFFAGNKKPAQGRFFNFL
ncbi:hypothetical protein DNJ99_16485 [Pseudomonas daroniae]|nr:hypothetical protein DNJ99_16485 [Pseudomonas daroniae]